MTRIIRKLNLEEYVEILPNIPFPTHQQLTDFSVFVSRAHSWYKLDAIPPGRPFFFYLDPFVSYNSINSNGSPILVERHDDGNGYLSTQKYRQKFGYMNYTWQSNGQPYDVMLNNLFIYDLTEKPALLPDEIIDAGKTYHSCLIYDICQFPRHPQFKQIPMMTLRMKNYFSNPACHTNEQEYINLKNIFSRLHEIDKTIDAETQSLMFHNNKIDQQLYELLIVERTRQLKEMTGAMQRVIDIVKNFL